MTLTIGTDAYYSLTDVRAYWAARDTTISTAWVALADADAEMLIRKATDWIDRKWDYIGDVATSTQRLKWPREYAYIGSNALDSTTIPWQIEEANALVAEYYRAGTYNMDGIVQRNDASVSSVKVDVIEKHFDTQRILQGSDVFTNVSQLVRPLIVSNGSGLFRA